MTAERRRAGTFPDLVDLKRWIHRPLCFDSPADARRWFRDVYRLDRTPGQAVSLYIGVEKHGLVGLLETWFDPLGIPILPTGGYASQSFVKEVQEDIRRQDRAAVLLNAGDFDPSGEDIQRDFVERVGLFARVERIALTEAHVRAYDLPPMLGKAEDARASAFIAKYGRLVQVELDALPADVLRSLFQAAIDAVRVPSGPGPRGARAAAHRPALPPAALMGVTPTGSAHHYLTREIRRLGAAEIRRIRIAPTRRARWGHAFAFGAIETLRIRLWDQANRDRRAVLSAGALVRASEAGLDDALKRLFPNLGTHHEAPVEDPAAYSAGVTTGRAIALRPALKGR